MHPGGFVSRPSASHRDANKIRWPWLLGSLLLFLWPYLADAGKKGKSFSKNPFVCSLPADPPLIYSATRKPTIAYCGRPVFNALSKLTEVFARVVTFDKENPHGRQLHCLDLFAGEAEVSKAYRRAGLNSLAMDYRLNGARNDVTCEEGFYATLLALLSVRYTGLLFAGPPCSSWVFMSSSLHCRHSGCPYGDTDEVKYRIQNILLTNLIVLMLVAVVRGVFVVVEQPSSSIMPRYPLMMKWSERHRVSSSGPLCVPLDT